MKGPFALPCLMLAFLAVACGKDSMPTQPTQPDPMPPAGKAVATASDSARFLASSALNTASSGTDTGSAAEPRAHGSNHPPTFNSSLEGHGLTLLLPRGPGDQLEFSGEPATDPDGDDISYRFGFAVPGLSGIQTPAEALFRITREGNSFVFQPDGDITPARFTSVYGEVATIPTLLSAIYASDGTDESNPEVFNVHLVYDGSAQFSAPAEYKEDQRWEIPAPIEMYEGTTMPESEELPTWTAVTAEPRQWRLENWSPPSIRCEIATVYDPYTLPDGGFDNALVSLDSEERATSGTVTLTFKTVPDYEMPHDGNEDNEYQIRVVNTHNIHRLGGEGSPTGCSGSVIDLTIRVKDVGVPAPPEEIEAGFQDSDDSKIDVNWTASVGFSENGSLVEFPAGFEVTGYDYRYRPDGADSWTEVTDTDLTETPVTMEDLTEDAYEIQVRARNSEGSGAWSSTVQTERVERTVSFGASQYTTMEGDPSGIEIAVYLDPRAGALPITVPITVEEKDGAGPDDYSGVPSSITFAPDDSMQTFTLMAMEDSDQDEGAEEVQLNFGDLPANVSSGTPASAEVVLEQSTTPAIQGLQITSTPDRGTTYGRDETIEVEVSFDTPVTLTGTPYLRLEFYCNVFKRAGYKNGSGTDRLIFEYRITRNDRDRNGISAPQGSIHLNGGTITALFGGAEAVLEYDGLPDDPNHKVNGCLRDE